MAELFGKADGLCGGRGGTMHLYDRAVGLFGTNGIVGAGIGQAVGIGMAARRAGHATTSAVAFFGDGAANHGALPRGAELRRGAAGAGGLRLREQPLRHGDAAARRSRSIRRSPRGRRPTACPAWRSTATTCWRSGPRCARRPTRARRGDGPTLIEAKTYRTVGHHEGDPVVGTYRTQEEVDAWAKRDPIDMFRRRLVEDFRAASAAGARRRSTRGSRRWSRRRSSSRAARPSPIRRPCAATSSPSRSTRRRRCAPPAGRRDAGAGLARRGARRHRRGDAGQPGDPLLRRGHRRARRQLRPHQGPLAGVRRRSGWSTRRSPSRASPPPPSAPRPPGARTVADLMFADFAFETAGQIFLQAAKLRYMSNGADDRADGGARRRRGAAERRAAPQRHLPSDLRAHAGARSSACPRPRPTPRG